MAFVIPADRIRLIVFDLDGTLIDSRKDLANSINAMLTEFHREPLPEEIIAEYIGDGAGMLVRRAMICGSTMASFCCEDFSLDRLRTLTRADIDARFKAFRHLTHFEDLVI